MAARPLRSSHSRSFSSNRTKATETKKDRPTESYPDIKQRGFYSDVVTNDSNEDGIEVGGMTACIASTYLFLLLLLLLFHSKLYIAKICECNICIYFKSFVMIYVFLLSKYNKVGCQSHFIAVSICCPIQIIIV